MLILLILITILGFLVSALCVCLEVLLELEIENWKEKENKNVYTRKK